jgi:2-oxoglutarate ferredoxin oxidoreductase subunit gamma
MTTATERSASSPATTKTRTEILISGFGGQGVVRMGQILGLCAIKQGHRVTMLKSHGTETRGGYVRAQLVISPGYVDSPVVENADVFVAFSAPAYKRFYGFCRGTILYDPEMVADVRADRAEAPGRADAPEGRAAPPVHVAVPATQLAKERFNNVLFANMVMLGALTRLAGMDYEAMKAAMLEVIPRFHAENLAAMEAGYTLPAVSARA